MEQRERAAKRMDHPFSEEELFQVMRRFLPVDDARAVAASAMSDVDSSGSVVEGVPEGSALHSPIDFSLDTLILLSLLSPATSDKVERWRRRFGQEPGAEDNVEWESRRADLLEWTETVLGDHGEDLLP